MTLQQRFQRFLRNFEWEGVEPTTGSVLLALGSFVPALPRRGAALATLPIRRRLLRRQRERHRGGLAGTPFLSSEAGHEHIRRLLAAGAPAALGKFNSEEFRHMVFHLGWAHPALDAAPPRRASLFQSPGLFPRSDRVYDRFCRLYDESLGRLDLVTRYFETLAEERYVEAKLGECCFVPPDARYFWEHDVPWTSALRGRRVLVVTRFPESIERQYAQRERTWGDEILPDFELITLRCPFVTIGDESPHGDWFDVLADLERRMDATDYDVALIGAGAYGVPLAVHAKARGRIGWQVGSMVQVIFGLRGGFLREYPRSLFRHVNAHWVPPSDTEKPPKAHLIRGGHGYW